MTDDEKLAITVHAFIDKLNSIQTWGDFKTMLTNVTKTQVRNFIKNNLTKEQNERQGNIDTCTSEISDIDDIKDELDAL